MNQKECCKLQGHENNLIKFVCFQSDCPYRYQKACAHCVIKLHGKHVEQMKEIEEFDNVIAENSIKAQQLIKESEELFIMLQNPLGQFFEKLKNQLIEVVDQIQQRYLIQNKERAQQLINNELEFIQSFNIKQQRCLTDQALRQYKNQIKIAKDKLENSIQTKEICQLMETNLILLLDDYAKTNQISYSSNTSRTLSQRNNSCHSMISPRTSVNVFNHNINISRQKKFRN